MSPEDRRFLIAYDTALHTVEAKDLGQRGGKNDPLGKIKARFAKDARAGALAVQMGKVAAWHRNRLLGLPQPEEASRELDVMFQEIVEGGL